MKILAFAASLKKNSVNAMLIKIVSKILKEQDCDIELIDFSEFDVPIYNGDIEESKGIPSGALKLKEKIEKCDGIVISSPEYNYSVPGTLKNLIDWTSRIRPQPFKDRNILVMSASPAMAGGVRGLWHLRVPLEGLGAFVYPEMFSLAVAHEAFDSQGNLKDKNLVNTLENNIKSFLKHIKNECK
ncbi:MAG: NAD(P)H-dependent oxidoreductase [Proteobacteria bacterium]|nr:NAD(P)H-dependent oxidoreductase [Pseudomonadota bacterium]